MDYHSMRKQFEPTIVKLVMLGESPPESQNDRYFYNTAGSLRENLFKATMQALGIACEDKAQGLREFQKRGVLLLDVTYSPVNKLDDKTERVETLERDYDALVARLAELPHGVPVVIVMAGIYDRFFHRLRNDGLNVVKRRIPFPSHTQRRVDEFCTELRSIAVEHDIAAG